jgi:hypothetical protein
VLRRDSPKLCICTLRIGEIALSKGNNAGQILAVDDVKLTLNKLVIHLRFSKTDQTGKGVSIEIPKITGSTIWYEEAEYRT